VGPCIQYIIFHDAFVCVLSLIWWTLQAIPRKPCIRCTQYVAVVISQCVNPFDAHCCHIGIAVKHLVPDRVKPSFEIFDIRHCDPQGWASECPDIKNYKWRLNPVWHRMLYSCTHMTTVGIKEWHSGTNAQWGLNLSRMFLSRVCMPSHAKRVTGDSVLSTSAPVTLWYRHKRLNIS